MRQIGGWDVKPADATRGTKARKHTDRRNQQVEQRVPLGAAPAALRRPVDRDDDAGEADAGRHDLYDSQEDIAVFHYLPAFAFSSSNQLSTTTS